MTAENYRAALSIGMEPEAWPRLREAARTEWTQVKRRTDEARAALREAQEEYERAMEDYSHAKRTAEFFGVAEPLVDVVGQDVDERPGRPGPSAG